MIRKTSPWGSVQRGILWDMDGVIADTASLHFRSWGFPQAVASSDPQANINESVEEYQIGGYFQALVSEQSLPSKPDPSIFLSAASRIGIAPPGGVVIEDSVFGIEGAARAGMKSIGVATSHPVEELEQTTLVVRRLADLNEALFSKYLNMEFPDKETH